jgi:hypothetical protein
LMNGVLSSFTSASRHHAMPEPVSGQLSLQRLGAERSVEGI